MNSDYWYTIIITFLILITFSIYLINPVEKVDALTSISVGFGPGEIAYNPFNHNVYVTNVFSSTISVINSSSNTVITNIMLPSVAVPMGIAYSPFDHNIYVAARLGNIIIINSSSNQIIGSIYGGDRPHDIEYNPHNGDFYITNKSPVREKQGITVMDAKSHNIIDIIPISSPDGLVYSHSNGHIYASSNINLTRENLVYSSVYSISSTNNIDAIIPIKGDPTTRNSEFHDLEYNPYDERIYVTSIKPDILTVIDTSSNKIVMETQLGSRLDGLNRNPLDGTILASRNTNTISVISPYSYSVIKDISPVGGNPSDITYNPFNGQFYVINWDRDKVTVLPPP